MSDQRPTFRFRLPWLPAAVAPPAPRPTSRPRTPVSTTPNTGDKQDHLQPSPTNTSSSVSSASPLGNSQVSSQTTATSTITSPNVQRPPFRPAGIAPSQASPQQSQASKTASQSPSSTPKTTRTSSSRPASPSSAANAPQGPLPSSPLRTTTTSRSKPKSPMSSPSPKDPVPSPPSEPHSRSKTPPLSASGSTLQDPLSPPSITDRENQLAKEPISQGISPAEKSEAKSQPDSQPSPIATVTPSFIADKELSAVLSEPKTQELNSKIETASNRFNNLLPTEEKGVSKETTTVPNPGGYEARSIAASPEKRDPETQAPIQEPKSSTLIAESKSLKAADRAPDETKEIKEMVKETNGKGHNQQSLRSFETLRAKIQPSNGNELGDMQHNIESRKDISNYSVISKFTDKTISQPRNGTVDGDTQIKTISDAEMYPLHKEIRDDISKLMQKLANGDSKSPTEERMMSVITLAGENRGASMQLDSGSSKKKGTVHIHRGYKPNPDENVEMTTDGEGSSRGMKSKDAKTIDDQATKAYINCNAQGINNSLIFNSSVSEQNPGVHLAFPRITPEPQRSTEIAQPVDTRKAEVNITPAQKLTYEPTVRRRCLQGLFLESSDSEPGNPGKPRRHGCRVGCKEKSKQNNIDIP